jgi:type III secretion protein T
MASGWPINLGNADELKAAAMGLGLVQARLMPMFLLVPFLNRNMVPRVASFGLAAALGLLVLPTLPLKDIPMGGELILILVKEGLIGLVMGFVLALPFWMFEALGFLVDNQRGASMAATTNPTTGNDSTPVGQLTGLTFITFFMVSGGLELMLGMIYDSYRQWAPLSFWPQWKEESVVLLIQQLNRLLTIGLLLAAPAMMAMFLAELGLALANRFTPQLQVFFLAMPIKSALGLFVLALGATIIFDFANEPIRELGYWIQRLNGVWGGPKSHE